MNADISSEHSLNVIKSELNQPEIIIIINIETMPDCRIMGK